MTKKFLSLLLAIVMICAMGAIPVSAATPTTLQEAISAAAAGATITLDKDYAENIIIEKSITLDLNGKKITAGADTTPAITVKGANVVVTITDSASAGSIEATKHAVAIENGASLVLESGNIVGNYGVRLLENNVKFTMNGGTITAEDCGVFTKGNVTFVMNGGEISATTWAVAGNGLYDGSTVTINGGKVVSTDYVALFHPQQGALTINGGYFEGLTAVYIKSGSIKITDGEFVGKGDAEPLVTTGDGANPTGDAVVIEQIGGSSNYAPIEEVTISGGSFASVKAAPVSSHKSGTATDAPIHKNFITGGKFEGEVALDTTLLPAGNDGLNTDGSPRIKYTATFKANGETIDTVTYYSGDEVIAEPAVPAKEGYYGYWKAYELGGNITVNAIYVKIPERSRVSFVADGKLVGIILYRANQDELTVLPNVPAKEGYVGTWAEYTLTGKNMIVRAVYTPIAE